MRTSGLGRGWHMATFGAAAFALIFQLVLVVQGQSPLAPELRPTTGEAVRRFFSYFTIQSNILVAVTTLVLTLDPKALDHERKGRIWRIARLASMVGITVTGIVHWFLLRPVLDLTGASYVADKLLHVVVPVLAVVGWVVFGPRRRVSRRDIAPALVWPVLWLLATLGLGPLVGWYAYPFLDVPTHGLGPVLLTCLGVALLFVALCLGATALDQRLDRNRHLESEVTR